MANEIIPTAEEMEMSGDFDDYQSMARALARLHVTAALKAHHAQLGLPEEDLEKTLSSYPLSKIQ